MTATTSNHAKVKRKKSKYKLLNTRAFSWVRDERTPRITGIVLMLSAVYLLIAFSSYLATWAVDQDKVMQATFWELLANSVKVDNKTGLLGAFLAHKFFYNWFGLSSYLFVFVFFTTGFQLVFRKQLLPMMKVYRYSLLALLWLSTTMSFAFSCSNGPCFPWGGGFGNFVSGWTVNFVGNVGTGFFLGFLLVAFLTIVFNINYTRLAQLPYLQPLIAALSPQNHGMVEFEDDGDAPVATQEDDPEEEEAQKGSAEKDSAIDLSDSNDKEEEVPESGMSLDIATPVEEPAVEPSTEATPQVETHPAFETVAPQPKDESPAEEDIQLDIEETPEEAVVEENAMVNYDPTLDLPKYKYPSLDLLENYGTEKVKIDTEELEKNKDQIINTLNNYNIEISKIKATIGPTVTLYEIVPAPGVRISKIKNLEDDIALSLAALGIRIIAPIPGKGTIGIEVPNVKKEVVSMRTVLASEKFQSAKMELPVAIGKNISNEIFVTDLAKMPHLLMAGATGQGKSVGLNAILASLLYKKHPSQLKLVLIDPKKVELSLFNHIEKHFLAKLPDEEEPIITDTKKVVKTLNSLCIEMDERYDLLKAAHCKNIKEYNQKFVQRKLNPNHGHRFMPYIVLVVDEFADLMMTAGKEVETPIARLAQLARAIGIHLVIATQRPSVNIITGTIKANFPARIAFRVTSKVDSRTILDTGGAEQLIGRGDMLLSLGSEVIRLQCAFIDTPEVEQVAEYIGQQHGYPEAWALPEFIDENDMAAGDFDLSERDDMFEDAARIVVQHQQGSTSLIQRRLKLGYNRAGRLIDQLEAAGIVGPHEGSKAREVLIHDEMHLEQFLQDLDLK